MSEVAPQGPPPGWYRDASSQDRVRWWDGIQWTDHFANVADRFETKSQAPAGWYPDPRVKGQQRWWDGSHWTAHIAAAGAGGAVGGFFYAESGPDLDGDGHVDGGLFDALADLF